MNAFGDRKETILNKIFSNDQFKGVDTCAIVERHDFSAKLRAANNATKSPSAKPLQGNSITEIPPEGIVISNPGIYSFVGNLVWTPTAASGIAISIQGNEITLNLAQYSLTGNISPAAYTGQYTGIAVAGHGNTIINGSVNKMTYHGIYAELADGLAVSNITIDGLNYYDTTHPDVTPCGIFIERTKGFTVYQCIVLNINVTAPSCAGIQVIESCNGLLSACIISEFVNNDGSVQGYSYLFSWQVNTVNCSCDTFQSHYQGLTVTTGHTTIGFIPIFCMSLKFVNCSAKNMTGCCDGCHGMSVFLDEVVTITNFKATNITDGVCPKNMGAKATGLEVYGFSIRLYNCRSSNIKAIVPQSLQSAGFSARGNYITFRNCIATNVLVTDANGNPSTDYGYGAGYGWAPDPRDEFCKTPATAVLYMSCKTDSCQLGFDTWNHIDCVWFEPVINNCITRILLQPKTATRTLSMDTCSKVPGTYVKRTVVLLNMAKGNEIL